MATMTIQLRTDPVSGKKDIIIALKSDDDALPIEHEQQHKALVEKVLGKGLVSAEALGKVVVERETIETALECPEDEIEGSREGVGQGGGR